MMIIRVVTTFCLIKFCLVSAANLNEIELKEASEISLLKEVFDKPSESILETIPEIILETIQETLLETNIPFSTSASAEPKWPWWPRFRKTSGIIFLHGLGIKAGDGRLVMCNKLSGRALGLSLLRNKIVCPKAPKRDAEVIGDVGKYVFPPLMIPGVSTKLQELVGIRSWFDFDKLPYKLVRGEGFENKQDLKVALGRVEEEIEKMIQEGIRPENIVLSGMSQGGALTLYTALHTRYKLGGFLPIVTWLPLLGSEPPASLPTPRNKDTPIFHMNGNIDVIVPKECGRATATAMEPVFTKYEQKNVMGTHLTTLGNPLNFPKIYCWLKRNVKGMAFSKTSPLRLLRC